MGQQLVLAGQSITPAVLNRIYGSADSVAHTVNNTSYAALSSTYAIPAADATSGTAYRLGTFGNGTWSTSATLTLAMSLAGTVIGTAPVISASALSNGAAFDFFAEMTIICVTDGSSGTWVATIKGTLTQSANSILPGTAADNTIGFSGCTHSAVTQDTTVADNLAIKAKWSSVTGTPTVSCAGTLFEKVN